MLKKKGSEREDMVEFLDRVAMDAQDIEDTINRARQEIVQTA